jgi:hypothetical protein
MCTLSIIRIDGGAGFRVVMSRDEQHDRPPALQPRWRGLGPGRAIWPIDPRGGGTWIAADDRGVVMCLLNYNLEPGPAPPPDAISRGAIIPALVRGRAGSPHHAAAVPDAWMARLSAMPLHRFRPFRLVVASPDKPSRLWCGAPTLTELRWNGGTLEVLDEHAPPACFVSSGLGDSRVLPRLELFRDLVGARGGPAEQDAFHAHRWDGREDISVLMCRADARTVSITSVSVDAGPDVRVRMGYHPLGGRDRASAGARPAYDCLGIR